MGQIYTVAIIGVGARGALAYGEKIHKATDRFKIVSLCDINEERLHRFGEKFEVPMEQRFNSDTEFFREKRADMVLIATPDKCHYGHAISAFHLGYDVMCEKPLSDSREQCLEMLQAQQKSGKKALVCHVLRYAPAFVKTFELLHSGAIGRLVAINALERVAYWHQAHSYVRGNWRNTDVAAPMILAKCCHDLDLLQYYAESKCVSVSSVGDLVHFKAENAPEGATHRCVDCPHKDTCPYSAYALYYKKWKAMGCPENIWPANVLVAPPLTEEKILKQLAEGDYGRCVYHCDNNVVDHQLTTMTFENGVKATLTMTAYTANGGRRYHFHGTMGELILEEAEERIILHKYGQEKEIIDTKALIEGGYGHGGGDQGLVNQLYSILDGENAAATSFEASVESHLMGICAEESRLAGGKLIYIHQ